MKQISIVSFTRQGFALSRKMRDVCMESGGHSVELFTTKAEVAECWPEAVRINGGLNAWCEQHFFSKDALIFIGASGIAVRTIAPFLVSKKEDPAVLVADELGRHLISLLSGHLGGGNALTLWLAERIGADPVITTASDVNQRLAIDVWAQKNDLVITDFEMAKKVAAEIVAGKQVTFCCDGTWKGALPKEFSLEDTLDYKVAVTPYETKDQRTLHLVPKNIILGVGCRREKEYDGIRKAVDAVLTQAGIHPAGICKIASVDLKANEAGLLKLAEELQVPFETFSAETLMSLQGEFTPSGFVKQITGVDNVCERAALAAVSPKQREHASFLCRKTAMDGVTAALLWMDYEVTM